MTPREAFKVGFLGRCVEEGLSLEQTHDRIKLAMEKYAVLESTAKTIAAILKGGYGIATDILHTAKPILLATPPILGGLAGYGLATMTDLDETDIEELKARELIAEYEYEIQKLLKQQQLRRHKARRQRTGRALL